jgi:uncharacterized membrane protein
LGLSFLGVLLVALGVESPVGQERQSGGRQAQ